MISIVIPIWAFNDLGREWKRDLNNAVYSWSSQTVDPHEIVVVNASFEKKDRNTVAKIVRDYPLVNLIAAPRKTRNLSWAFNVGIKRATGEYILATGSDIMAGDGYCEVLSEMVDPGRHHGSECGFLNGEAPLDGDIVAEWETILDYVKYVKRPLGAIQCAHRSWWHRVRGYDENFEFRFVDSDIVSRAKKTLDCGIVKWKKAQLLHAEHKLSRAAKGCKHGREYLMASTSIECNPNNWGEI